VLQLYLRRLPYGPEILHQATPFPTDLIHLFRGLALAGPELMKNLRHAVTEAGYEPRRIKTGADAADHERAAREMAPDTLSHKLPLAALLTTPVFVLEMGAHSIPGLGDWIMKQLGHERQFARLVDERQMSNQVGPFERHGEKNRSATIAQFVLGAATWFLVICN
jgi:hypothetical protein